jgi:lipoate-protein ligase B
VAGRTGVFLDAPDAAGRARKIASIGVGLRGWITWHGFALNVTTAPDAFADIVPCGLHDVRMVSLAEALGVAPAPALFSRARAAVAAAFERSLA